ncbi:MAG: hypothetical protein EBT07_05250 [Actinobacteria bacterium]|nr:hypothetical protein [Actinomycetota bacterium]
MFTLGSGRLKLGTWLSGGLYTQVSGVSVTPSTASGSVPAGTYYVRVAGKNSAGSATPSETYIVVLSATGKLDVSWTALSGASAGYDVYVGTVNGYDWKQGSVSSGTTTLSVTSLANPANADLARYKGLQDIGEIGGDVEFDISFQEREFFGQYNFPIAKAHFGGKSTIRVRGLEMDPMRFQRLFSVTATNNASTLPTTPRRRWPSRPTRRAFTSTTFRSHARTSSRLILSSTCSMIPARRRLCRLQPNRC